MSDRTSLRTLQNQYAYKQDVHVRKGEKLIGGFGKTIYKAEWINRKGSPIVLLEMEGSKASEEILLYISLSHPHIIKTYGLVKPNTQIINTKSVLLLQEYARDGDLGRMLTDRYFIPSQPVLIEIFIQISNAMSYLTEVNIIHGDLACRNVLVFKSDPQDPKRNLVKLIDFGLTRDESIPLDEKISIPVRYAATEILRSNGRSGYSEKSDVFSFAVLMWEAYSPEKRMPYELISDDKEVCRRKLNGEKLPRPDKCDAEIWALMIKCWNDRPEDRPTFQMIHTQLKNIQNLNASSTTLNPILSRSSTDTYDSHLFNSENNICPDCGSQYTDYHSHLNTCGEQEVPSYISDDQYRRASFQDHTESYTNLSRPIPTELSPSSLEIDDENLFPCEFCNKQYSIHEIDIHQRSCLDNPQNYPTNLLRRRSSVRSDRKASNRNSDSFRSPSPNRRSHIDSSPNESHSNTHFPQEKPQQLNTTPLPCEICKKSIDASQFAIHQRQCDENDQRRIENERRRIEQIQNIIEADCKFCDGKYPIAELDNHQDNCPLNPEKLFNEQSILLSTRSNSFRDLGSLPSVPKSTVDVTQPKSAVKSDEEPSCIRCFVSWIFSFRKK